jgi:hypothetical protein
MSAAQILEPASAAKLVLIRDYLRLCGAQRAIDEGWLWRRYWLPGGEVFDAVPEGISPGTAMERAMGALLAAYEPHRSALQAAYEEHVNWEFEEDELAEVVRFLGTAAGQHYRDAAESMDFYVECAIREPFEDIVEEARIAVGGDG